MQGSHTVTTFECETVTVSPAKKAIKPSSDNGSGDAPQLSHVVVAAGTPQEWRNFGSVDWEIRLDDIVRGASVGGAQWITLLPYGGEVLSLSERLALFEVISDAVPLRLVGEGHLMRGVWQKSSALAIIVDPSPNGQVRFAAILESLRLNNVTARDLDEVLLAQHVMSPADVEPDLVVVFGPPDQLPTSLIWELGYSELVFLDLKWDDLSASHLELAVDDFDRRHRRFGGLDS